MSYTAISYTVIYDGDCNLCTNLVRLLEQLDRGQQFRYISMQDQAELSNYNMTLADCEAGVILINPADRTQCWQGAAAVEEIGRLLPLGNIFVTAYRHLPGMKSVGDRVYAQVRDHRYDWFGRRAANYRSAYPDCDNGCDRYFRE
jgi:predicted DCC family thiol-disulfide oxidoreductase YuxK